MLFDSTLRRELARAFGATLVVIVTIVVTMFLIRVVGQAARGVASPQDVVLVLGYTSLVHLPTMLALSLFVAVVVALGRMYRDSEMSVWFASGVGLTRFVRPVLATAWPVLAVIALLLLFVTPWSHRNTLELRERYEQRSDLSRVTPGVFQSSSDGRRVFFIERDPVDATQARNVFILQRDPDGESVTSARAGRIDFEGPDRFLTLERGQRNQSDASSGETAIARFESYRVLVDERAARAARERPPRTMRTIDLLRDATPRHDGELAARFGLLAAAVNLVLLGVGLAASNPRRASNWNLLFALLAFVVYFNLVSLTQAWVGTGRVALPVALGALHGSVFALAIALVWWRDHAATLRLRGAQRRPVPT
ncbi:MAG: LPS export ABC transporter permease LptF [Rubrivivax sp.]|jgi:lipopolysaccharide export system permease protein|nr:LPS export ABC transporter permease LptF [Rubrivivax sp.]